MTTPEITVCPSLLSEGHSTYSAAALRALFNGAKVSCHLPFAPPSAVSGGGNDAMSNVGRMSLSGAQPKFGLVVDGNMRLRYSDPDEQSTHILKPRPTGYQIINHE